MPDQPGQVTRSDGFLYLNAKGGVTRLTGVVSIQPSINMAANHYKPGNALREMFLLGRLNKSSLSPGSGKKSYTPGTLRWAAHEEL